MFMLRVRMSEGDKVQKFLFDTQKELGRHLCCCDYTEAYTCSIVKIKDLDAYNNKNKKGVINNDK